MSASPAARRRALGVACLSVLGVLYVVLGDLGRSSPGPISAVHAHAEGLDGGAGCAACHGGWSGDMTSACLECHEPIRAQLEQRTGLHGALEPGLAASCARCHSEHHGASFALVNDRSFEQAGFAGRDGFDHAAIGFPMAGKHLELGCVECHEHADVAELPAGATRFLGARRDCRSCHEDPHGGRMGLACATCHQQTSFTERVPDGHERFLALTGAHERVACRTCHANDSTHALERFGHGDGVVARTCADCHDSPHRAALVEGVAALDGVASGLACASCHRPEHTSWHDERLTVTPQQHACTGFPLDAPHDAVACAACHRGPKGDFRARHPGRDALGCEACHDDPHGGQFRDPATERTACIACHGRTEFTPHAFTLERHAAAGFPLTGKHRETTCESCHRAPEDGGPKRFRGLRAGCVACHGDAHRGFFEPFLAKADDLDPAVRAGGGCAHCHNSVRFAERPRGFDHARWTGFALDGAHAQIDCETCHVRRDEPDAFGRRFGRSIAPIDGATGCAACHADPHRGAFDRPGLPTSVEGRTDCARCHTTASFRDFPRGFDHGAWTGFALEGAHAKTGCAACHAPLDEPDPVTQRAVTWAKGNRCADCHLDPHAGQFRVGGATSCERCHSGTTRFTDLSFDHDRDSRFPLDEAHRGLACGACHKPVRENGATFVRYKPLGRRCVDCHGGNRDPFRNNGK